VQSIEVEVIVVYPTLTSGIAAEHTRELLAEAEEDRQSELARCYNRARRSGRRRDRH
jgi:hypothetical protein